MTSHVLVIGETQSGKTYFANELHKEWPGPASIFINTNHTKGIAGVRCDRPSQIAKALLKEPRVNLLMPEVDRDELNVILGQVKDLLFDWGVGSHGKQWGQVLVDEAQEYSREGTKMDPVRTLAARGLGAYGVRLVCITQYPVALNTTTRTNLKDRVIFSPGEEGELFLRNRGLKEVERVFEWTANPYHFARYHGSQGPYLHIPL